MELNLSGISKKDSLHIASAIEAEAVYFITVDKGILSKKDKIKDIYICNPIKFISIIEEIKK